MQIKTCKDYYEEMYKLYPEVPKADIKKILNQGWKIFYLYNSMGGDVCVRDNSGFFLYTGFMKKNPLDFFKYYVKKLAIKLRILYRRKKIKWDGYYYFALQQSQYDTIFKQNAKGRRRKNFTFENIMLYQILDECKIKESSAPYIFRLPYTINIGYKYFMKKIKTDKAELIITREPLKFKDILVNDNEYELL